MKLWRIASETRDYPATDLTGSGAAAHPGRWNARGEYIVYASPSIALAVLETAAYVRAGALPLAKFVVEIEVPAAAWESRMSIDMSAIDPAWSAIPAGMASVHIGSTWYQSQQSLLLEVPSVIVPEERNILINSKHPDAAHLVARAIRRASYEALFR